MWHQYVPLDAPRAPSARSSRTSKPVATGILTPAPANEFVPFPPRVAPVVQPSRPAAAEPKVLDEMYRGFRALKSMSLTDDHRRALRDRGLTDEQIERHGYRTLPTHRSFWTFGPDMAAKVQATPGFVPCRKKGEKVRFERYQTGPALVIPVLDHAGFNVGLRVRLDKPNAGGKYRWFVLDEGPEIPWKTHFAFPKGNLTGQHRVVYVVEGEIKANILADHFGVPAIALPGIGNQAEVEEAVRRLLPLGVQILVVAADADARRKPQVAEDAGRLFRTLRSAFPSLTTGVATWPEEHGKGIDDVIAAGHTWEVEFPQSDAAFSQLYGWHLDRDGRVTRTPVPAASPVPATTQGKIFELTARAENPLAVNSKILVQTAPAEKAPPTPPEPEAAEPPCLPDDTPLDERPLPTVACPCRKRLLQYIGDAPIFQGHHLAIALYCGRWRCVCRLRLRIQWARAIRAHLQTHVEDGGRLYLAEVAGGEAAYTALTQWLRTHGVQGRYLGVQPLDGGPFTVVAAIEFKGSQEVTADAACAALFAALQQVHVDFKDRKRRPVRNGRQWRRPCEDREPSGNWLDRGRVGYQTLEDLEGALQAVGIDVQDLDLCGDDIRRAFQFHFPSWTPEQVEQAVQQILAGIVLSGPHNSDAGCAQTESKS